MKYFLAPLAEFTDAPFRRLCYECGSDLAYTEMVSAAGLAYGSSPTRQLMEKMSGEGPVALQLFGSKENNIAAACRGLAEGGDDAPERRFCEINLNAGCPMPKIMHDGDGAKLIEDPQLICRLLKAMKENTGLPVTLKTRLGPRPGDDRIFEIVDAAEQAGAVGIIVHARYTSQMHGGPLHLDVLEEVVRRAHVPVTGNGSVCDASSAAEMAATGVSAIMIGRAALSHPMLFSSLKTGLPEDFGDSLRPQILRKHLGYILAFRDMLAAKYPNDHIPSVDAFASVKMHTHLFRYFKGLPGAAALRARLNTIRTLAEIESVIAEAWPE